MASKLYKDVLGKTNYRDFQKRKRKEYNEFLKSYEKLKTGIGLTDENILKQYQKADANLKELGRLLKIWWRKA